MNLSPKIILEQFEKNEINKSFAFEQLLSFVENSEYEPIREEAIQILDQIGIFNDTLFETLENLIISDPNERIRNIVLRFLGRRFESKAIKPLKWAIDHEENYECLIMIIELLKKVNSEESKLVLYNKTKNIIRIKYLNKEKRIENKKFKKVIKKLLKTKKYEFFDLEELSLILIHFITVANLTKLYPNVFYDINPENGLLRELDLSDYLEYEVKGMPFGWKNNIKSTSEVLGLNFLKSLKKIDLSNNQIESVKELVLLKNLTHVILNNNNISDIQNLQYIKKLQKLEYLDLRNNDIVKKIQINEFDPKTRVLLEDSYIKIK